MKFNNRVLGVAVASALSSLYVGQAFAVYGGPVAGDLILKDGTNAPLYLASELLSVESNTQVVVSSEIHGVVGFSLGSQVHYVRVDFDGAYFAANGATTKAAVEVNADPAAPTAGMFMSAQQGAAAVPAAVPPVAAIPGFIATGTKLASGGDSATKDTYALFTLSPDTTNAPDATTPFVINLAAMRYRVTKDVVKMRVRVYNEATASDAASGAGTGVYDKTITLFSPKAGLEVRGKLFGAGVGAAAISSGNGTLRQSSIASGFKKFTAGSQLTGRAGETEYTTGLGTIELVAVTGVLSPVTGVQVTLPEMLGDATKLQVNGDFSVASSVRLDYGSAACSTTEVTGAALKAGTIAADKQSVSFSIAGTAGADLGRNYNLCYTSDKASIIPPSRFKVDLLPAAANTPSYTAAMTHKDLPVGEIKREGVRMEAVFSTSLAATANRLICENTSNKDVTINSFSAYANSGVTITYGTQAADIRSGKPVTIPANGRVAMQLSNLVTGLSSGTAFGVTMDIGADASDVSCTYQLILPGSDVQTVVPMWEQ